MCTFNDIKHFGKNNNCKRATQSTGTVAVKFGNAISNIVENEELRQKEAYS